jgi:hypothetical protein
MERETNMKSIIKSLVHRAEAQHRTTRCILIAAAVIALGSRVGSSAPYFYAKAGTAGAGNYDQHDGTTGVGAGYALTVPVTGGSMSMSASAQAGPGTCGASARATLSVSSPYYWGGGDLSANAKASFSHYDIMITGNGSANPDGTVSGVLNLHYSGAIGAQAMANATLGGRGNSLGYAKVQMAGSVANGGAIAGEIGTQQACDSFTGCTFSYEPTGIFAGFTGDNAGSSGVFSVLTNTPVGLSISVQADGVCSGAISGSDGEHVVFIVAGGLSAFGRTVSFPLTGPVFDLPAGFTANSESGLIVNNQYLPNLMIARSGTDVVLTWLASPGAVVHSTESLQPPIQWTEVTNIVAMGITNMVTENASSGSKFFRLVR